MSCLIFYQNINLIILLIKVMKCISDLLRKPYPACTKKITKRPHTVDVGDNIQIWTVVANALNVQLRTAEYISSSTVQLDLGLKYFYLTPLTTCSLTRDVTCNKLRIF